MSETMKAALDAALRFHDGDVRDLEKTVETAKRFHQELVTAAPGATEDWDESWYSRVNTWIRALSGDQRGSVESALRNSAQVTPLAYGYNYAGPPQMPVYQPPVGPVAPSAELLAHLNQHAGDPRSAGDVQKAVDSWWNRTLAPEPAALSETLGRRDNETLIAAARRVMTELAEWRRGDRRIGAPETGRMAMNEIPLTQTTREERG